MPRTVLVPLAEGFEQIEASTIIGVLRRAGLEVTTASLDDTTVTSSHGLAVQADTTLDDVVASGRPFHAVVLPGGMPGAAHLRDDERVLDQLRAVVERGGTAAAVCAAPIALEAAGLLTGHRATAHPNFRDHLESADVLDEPVVVDPPIVTGAGPGPAMAFSLALVERLVGVEKADELRTHMGVT